LKTVLSVIHTFVAGLPFRLSFGHLLTGIRWLHANLLQ